MIGVAIKIYIYNYGKVVFRYNFDEYSKEKYENESKAWLSLNNAKIKNIQNLQDIRFNYYDKTEKDTTKAD